MKFKVWAVALLAAVMLAACGGNANEDNASKENDTKDIKALVQDYSAGNIEAKSASITSKQLIVDDKKVYDLPEDEFFVSIAPYVNETHP